MRWRSHTSSLSTSSSVFVCVLLLLLFRLLTHHTVREIRQQYTLNPIPGTVIESPPSSTALANTVLQPMTPTVRVPQASSSKSGLTRPVRTQRSQVKAQPFPTHVNIHIPADTSNPMSTNAHRVETPKITMSEVDTSHTVIPSISQATPSNPQQTNTTPAELDGPTSAATLAKPDAPVDTTANPGATPLLATEIPSDGASSDSGSYTLTISDVFDVGSDDSAPFVTGPWRIVDHFTSEVICNDDQHVTPALTTPPAPLCLGWRLRGLHALGPPTSFRRHQLDSLMMRMCALNG